MTPNKLPPLPERLLSFLEKHGGWQGVLEYVAELEAIRQSQSMPARAVSDSMVRAAQGKLPADIEESFAGKDYAEGFNGAMSLVREELAASLTAALQADAREKGEAVSGEAGAALRSVYDDFCAKDNGDVPLENYPHGAVNALARAGWAVVPCALPFAILGESARAGLLETGNPKHLWDYLIAKTRIYPNTALATQPAQASEKDIQDAKRYRMIRLGLSDWHGDCYAMTFDPDGDSPVSGESLDALADKMISRKETK